MEKEKLVKKLNFREKMKERDRKTLDLLLHSFRFSPLRKKQHKLNVLGIKNKSLVFDDVANKHALYLKDMVHFYMRRYKANQNSLRWVTLLDSVVGLDVADVINQFKNAKTKLRYIVKSLPGVHMLGAFEFEVFNYEYMKRHMAEVGQQCSRSTRNKIDVLQTMGAEYETYEEMLLPKQLKGSRVLVHIHAIVDFGNDVDRNIEKFKREIRRYTHWNLHWAQLHIESLYSTKSLDENIKYLCDYMTKSGNEELRYKVFFGRDKFVPTTDEIEASIYRYPPIGDDGKVIDRSEFGYENVRHLTHKEIMVLNDITYSAMISERKQRKQGYLLIV